jgi:hypothetical protein
VGGATGAGGGIARHGNVGRPGFGHPWRHHPLDSWPLLVAGSDPLHFGPRGTQHLKYLVPLSGLMAFNCLASFPVSLSGFTAHEVPNASTAWSHCWESRPSTIRSHCLVSLSGLTALNRQVSLSGLTVGSHGPQLSGLTVWCHCRDSRLLLVAGSYPLRLGLRCRPTDCLSCLLALQPRLPCLAALWQPGVLSVHARD